VKTKLIGLYDAARESLWFTPTLFTLGGVVLAFILPAIDRHYGSWITETFPRLQTTADASQSTLSVIAGAVMTVAGVVLSITIVALSTTSSQFGSRLLRSFRTNRITQVAIGIFLATGVYSLLVLATLRGDNYLAPHLSVQVAILMTLASLATFLAFIHSTAVSIQAPNVVLSVATELDATIDQLYPERLGAPPAEDVEPDEHVERSFRDSERATVSSTLEGYLQALDADRLIHLACEHDLVVRLNFRPGEFIARGSSLLEAAPAVRVTAEVAQQLNACHLVGANRTPRQDIEYGFLQLVEMAVRALSPGINDPFTAANCIDRISAALSRLARRKPPARYRFDDQGNLRVIAKRISFCEVCDSAYDQIREHGLRSYAVTRRLLLGIDFVGSHVGSDGLRECLRRQAAWIAEGFRQSQHVKGEIEKIESLAQEVQDRLEGDSS